jgi:predicted nuclease with TOPRIM domain
MAEKNGITRLERAQAAAWKAIRETQKSIRESREESKKAAQESREEMREFRESMRESLQKVSDNIDRLSEENREFRKSLQAANDRSDKFAHKFGTFWELMVVPNIKEKFNELGFHFESVGRNLEFDKPNINGRTLAEVDIILENGDSAIVVEVKDSFKKKYLAEHLVRMKKLKTLPRFANKKLYGAIAAGFVKEESKQQAFEHGFYVLNRPDTMSVEIEPFPKGCKPRAW